MVIHDTSEEAIEFMSEVTEGMDYFKSNHPLFDYKIDLDDMDSKWCVTINVKYETE